MRDSLSPRAVQPQRGVRDSGRVLLGELDMNVTVRICAFPSLVRAFPGVYPALGRRTGEHAARDYRTPTPTPPGATG